VSAGDTLWTVRTTEPADDDFRSIIRWTALEFGKQQARAYAETLKIAVRDLRAGPTLTGVKVRHDIAAGILTLHVARNGRKGKHFLMFRVSDREGHVLDVLRILHDAMDLQR
jgi:toxin ParE1/3/4